MSAVRRAWGWVAALRDGATTPWSEWAVEGAEEGPWLPGAQQLELLRRLNLEAEQRGSRVDLALAERVLLASAPGRGRADLLLAGAGDPPQFGPRPVDPAVLPEHELTRIAAGLVAEDLARVDRAGCTPGPTPVGWYRPWAPSYRVVGHPWLVPPVRARLAKLGRPPREHPAAVYVLGADVATMVVDAWTCRVFDEGAPRFEAWLDGFLRADRLPPRADVLTPARVWSDRVGRDRVTIVLDLPALAARLRLRRLPAPLRLDGASVELVRRVGSTLGLAVGADRRAVLLRRVLGPRLDGGGGTPLALPDHASDWLDRRSESFRSALGPGGYPVLGDPDRPSPHAPSDTGGDPSETEILALAMRLLLDPLSPPGAEEGQQR